jgi:hypothetical protein
MRPAPGCPYHMPPRPAGSSWSSYGALPAVLGLPAFVEVRDGPARVLGFIQLHHAQGVIHGYRAGRGSADPPILQPPSAPPWHSGHSSDELSAR